MRPPHRARPGRPGRAPDSAKGFGVPDHPPRGGLSPVTAGPARSPAAGSGGPSLAPRTRSADARGRPGGLPGSKSPSRAEAGCAARVSGEPRPRREGASLTTDADARQRPQHQRRGPQPPRPHLVRRRRRRACPTVSGGARGHFSRSGRGEGMRWVGRHGAGRRLALPPVPRSSGPCAGERAAGNRGPSFPASPPPAGILLDPQTRRGWDRSGVVDAPRRSVCLEKPGAWGPSPDPVPPPQDARTAFPFT